VEVGLLGTKIDDADCDLVGTEPMWLQKGGIFENLEP
jgi:hypothetical protein